MNTKDVVGCQEYALYKKIFFLIEMKHGKCYP